MAKSKQLEERVTEAMETIADAVEVISESTKAIEASQRMLNDNFLLHQAESKADHKLLCEEANGMKEEVKGMRQDFREGVYPILKWLAIGLVAVAGGAEGLRLLGVV